MGRWPAFFSHWASLPEVVVLPEPWRPAMRITLGGWEDFWKRAVSLPRTLMSSSWTILTICSEGLRAVATFSPMARARMCSMSSLTTARFTSDSRRARRISRRASEMFSSEMVPWPRRVLKERWSLSLRFSNMTRSSLSAGKQKASTADAHGVADRRPNVSCPVGWQVPELVLARLVHLMVGVVGEGFGRDNRDYAGFYAGKGPDRWECEDSSGVCGVSAGGEGAEAGEL